MEQVAVRLARDAEGKEAEGQETLEEVSQLVCLRAEPKPDLMPDVLTEQETQEGRHLHGRERQQHQGDTLGFVYRQLAGRPRPMKRPLLKAKYKVPKQEESF